MYSNLFGGNKGAPSNIRPGLESRNRKPLTVAVRIVASLGRLLKLVAVAKSARPELGKRKHQMNGFELILPFLKPSQHLILDDAITEVERQSATTHSAQTETNPRPETIRDL
jgi:hypothetical protein